MIWSPSGRLLRSPLEEKARVPGGLQEPGLDVPPPEQRRGQSDVPVKDQGPTEDAPSTPGAPSLHQC